jgi:phosphate transport system protein
METPSHARHVLDVEMQRLEHMLLEMASIAETMVATAVESLLELDVEKAKSVLERDDEIDARDHEIENLCLRLLLLQQPTAGDLRAISTAMKMITDIERIGDLAVDIAKSGMKIEKEFGTSTIVDIPRIASLARIMIRLSIEAFVRRDLDLVNEIIAKDDDVDSVYRDLREQIHSHMRNQPDAVISDSWVLLAIHHLERIADHAVNIAERVYFMVTGEMANLAPSHRPDSSQE